MEVLAILSFLVEICSKVCSCSAKHVAYPFTTTSNTDSLKSGTKELGAKKQDINNEITNAQRTDGVPTEEVLLWLCQVEAVERKAEDIKQNYQQLCRCLCNISLNLRSNYKISRSAAKARLEVKSLIDRRATFQQVTVHRQCLAKEMPASSSKSPNLESALSAIMNDTDSIMGIWGVGGVGKTHLLKQINNELSKNGAFSVVIFVTCSQGCSEEKAQTEIIKKLGLTESDSVEERGSTILRFLKEKSFALLLDDLWESVDLETIGIPMPTSTQGSAKRKIVMTTRSTQVCGAMGVSIIIRVGLLNWDQSWSLFIKNVTEWTDPIIQQYAEEMVKELGGLPLALIVVGKAMSNKTDPREWELAVKRLEEGRPPEGTDEAVYHRLMLSYDYLKNPALQQCFLHCSLWPEDSRILKIVLIELWMGLGLIDEPNDIHTAYLTGYSYIGSLQAVGLLETPTDDRVALHDVIRDMALWIARNQGAQMNKWIVPPGTNGFQEIQLSPDTEKLSLRSTKAHKVSFSPTESASKLSLLIGPSNSDAVPFAFFPKLIVLDLSVSNFEAFPAEICQLVCLQYLNLSSSKELKSLPQELGALTKLKYLLLRNMPQCTIPTNVLPKLQALRLVDVTCRYLKFPEDFSRKFEFLEKELECLSCFQALGITIFDLHDFQKLSTGTVPVRQLQIESLGVQEGCLSFSSNFLGNTRIANNLLVLELKFISTADCVKFERSDDQSICRFEKLEELSFRGMDNMQQIEWIGIDPKEVFSRLQVLKLKGCYLLRNISWVACLPWIRELRVRSCRSMKQLISIDDLHNAGLVACQPSFRCLKKMDLSYNYELECISDPTVTFPALEKVFLISCNMLKKLPFKTNNPPRELTLEGTEEWWNNIEMDDINDRSLLQPFFKKK